MAIIDDVPQEQMPPESVQKSAQSSDSGITPESIKSKMRVPPQFKDAYERVVVAGMKIMFDQSTHAFAMKRVQQGEGSVGQRLGNAVAGLLSLILEKGKGGIPPQVVVPAGITLLVSAADFMNRSGIEAVPAKEVGVATEVMIDDVLKMFKIDPAKAAALEPPGGLVDNTPAGEPQPPEAPMGEPQPPEEEPLP